MIFILSGIWWPALWRRTLHMADKVSDFEDGIDMLVFDAADDADTSSLAAVGLTVTDQDGRAVIRYDNYDLVELRFISADDITVDVINSSQDGGAGQDLMYGQDGNDWI